jgi:(p)ppGpp synthase/HD superfamily hydrolase
MGFEARREPHCHGVPAILIDQESPGRLFSASPQEPTVIHRARQFAVERHGDQKYGDLPYWVHLDRVAAIARDYGSDAVVIAYLHDVVEDTPTTLEEIAAEFGNFVSRCVQVVTDEPGADRRERKARTYRKMARIDRELEVALIVKAADRLANLRACTSESNQRLLAVYRREQAVFRDAVFRPALCDPIWQEIEELVG